MGGLGLIRAVAIFTCIISFWATPTESVSSTFSEVFLQCIRAENLPAIEHESEILKVLLTISQTNSVFMSFLECMGNKTVTFHNSNDSTEWYLARVFDKRYARMFGDLYQVAANSTKDVSCLTTMGKMDRLENCLRNVTKDIGMIKRNHSALLGQMSNKQFKIAICSTLEATRGASPQACISGYDFSNCSRVTEQFLMSFIMMISCNNSYSLTTTTSTPASPTPYTMPPILISSPYTSRPLAPPTAFFSCLSIVYPGESLQMLFPPSEIGLDLIKNLTESKRLHEMDMDKFCSKITAYSQCVKIKLTDPTNTVDALLAQYVDADNFGNAFSEYCANKELVNSNFECAYRSTKQAPVCHGGMNDVITAVINTNSVQIWTLCRRFKTARECRINKQLKICDSKFATVMETVLKGVLNEQCLAGEIIFPENQMTDLLLCYASYMGGVLDRLPKEFVNPNKRPDMPQIIQFVLKETTEMCSNKDALFSCLEKKLKSSTKMIDQFMKSMFSIENMVKIMDFTCNMVPDLKADSSCLLEGIGDITNNKFTECITDSAESMAMSMRNMTGMTNASSEVPTEAFCEGMGSILDCYKPILSKCDRKIVGKFNELLDETKKTCGDLSYKLEFQSESASGFISLAPLTLALTILANYLV